MIYFLLISLFIAVFVFIAWRLLTFARPETAPEPESEPPETYVCPVCDDQQCDCHKKEDL